MTIGSIRTKYVYMLKKPIELHHSTTDLDVVLGKDWQLCRTRYTVLIILSMTV